VAKEAVRPSINVPRQRGLSPGTGDAVLIAYAVRKKGGNRVASQEEGRKEGRKEIGEEKEEVVGERDRAREMLPRPIAI
jgi:hypothetical protein